jgi:hypothetical protein
VFIPIYNSYRNLDVEWKDALTVPLHYDNVLFTGVVVSRIMPAMLNARGTQMRVRMSGPDSGSTSIVEAYVGYGSSVGFSATPVQILVGGNTAFTLPSEGVVSDVLTFDSTPDKPLCFAFQIASSKFNRMYTAYNTAAARKAGWNIDGYVSGNANFYRKANATDPEALSKSGYTAIANRLAIIEKIEVA